MFNNMHATDSEIYCQIHKLNTYSTIFAAPFGVPSSTLPPYLPQIFMIYLSLSVFSAISKISCDIESSLCAFQSFVLPSCEKCGGILKTDVVFFGDNVSREDVEACYEKVGNFSINAFYFEIM